MNIIWEQTLRMLSFSDANVRYVFTGMALLGLSGGVLGSFTLLRKRALIGDALAHAALPGICIAFLITGIKVIWVLLIGAYLSGAVGVAALLAIRNFSRIKEDSALAIVLTVFFGVGIVLLTYIQKSGSASQSGLDKFLFGQSASLIRSEVVLIGATAVILLILSALVYKELKLLCFDPLYSNSIGFPSWLLDSILMALTVGAVVIGLQAVGVVLMAALLIIPPVSARMWSDRLGRMILIAGIIGAFSGALGTYLSFLAPKMPSGPLTVLAATSIFIVSVLIAPDRGVISRVLRRRNNVRRTRRENCLRAIAELMETKAAEINSEFSLNELSVIRNWSKTETLALLKPLLQSRAVEGSGSERFVLAAEGIQMAQNILKRHRLWEQYLVTEADIAPDHVDRDADEIEHLITPETEDELSRTIAVTVYDLSSPHPLGSEESAHA